MIVSAYVIDILLRTERLVSLEEKGKKRVSGSAG